MNNETYKKKVVDFSDEKNITVMDITVGLRGLYVNDAQSVFNNVQDADQINDNILLCIYTYCIDKKNKVAAIEGVNIDSFYNELDQTNEEIKPMIYNKNYGFDLTNDNRLCIPYSRKDTPLIGSNFSSIMMTLILTFKIYNEEEKHLLKYEDFKYIVENTLIFNKMYEIKNYYNTTNTYFNLLKDSQDMKIFLDILDYINVSVEDIHSKVNSAYNQYTNLIISDSAKQLIIYHFIKSINHEKIK